MGSGDVLVMVLAHEPTQHFRALLESLDEADVESVVHVDARASLKPFKAWGTSATFIRRRHAVRWGGWGGTQATLELMSVARRRLGGSGYGMLLSADSYPLLPWPAVSQRLLAGGLDYIELEPLSMPQNAEKRDRIRPVHLSYDRNAHWRWIKFVRGLSARFKDHDLDRQFAGLTAACGSQWWALRADTISAILDASRAHARFRFHARFQVISEEFYIPTLLATLGCQVGPSVLFQDWQTSVHSGPGMLDIESFDLRVEPSDDAWTGFLVARKFPPNSVAERALLSARFSTLAGGARLARPTAS